MCDSTKNKDVKGVDVNGQNPPPCEAENVLTIGKIIDTLSVGDWLKLGSCALTVVFLAYTFGKWQRSNQVKQLERELKVSAVMEKFYPLYFRLITEEEEGAKKIAVKNFVSFIKDQTKVQPDGSKPIIQIKVCPKSSDTKIELPNNIVYPVPSIAVVELEKAVADSQHTLDTERLTPDASAWAVEGWLRSNGSDIPSVMVP